MNGAPCVLLSPPLLPLSLVRNSDVRSRICLCHSDITDTLFCHCKALKGKEQRWNSFNSGRSVWKFVFWPLNSCTQWVNTHTNHAAHTAASLSSAVSGYSSAGLVHIAFKECIKYTVQCPLKSLSPKFITLRSFCCVAGNKSHWCSESDNG